MKLFIALSIFSCVLQQTLADVSHLNIQDRHYLPPELDRDATAQVYQRVEQPQHHENHEQHGKDAHHHEYQHHAHDYQLNQHEQHDTKHVTKHHNHKSYKQSAAKGLTAASNNFLDTYAPSATVTRGFGLTRPRTDFDTEGSELVYANAPNSLFHTQINVQSQDSDYTTNDAQLPNVVGAPLLPVNTGVAPVPVNVGVARLPVNVGVAPVPVNVGVAPVPVNVGVAPVPVNVGVAPVPVGVTPVQVGVGVAPAPVNVGVAPVPVGVAVAPAPVNFGVAPAPVNVGVAQVPVNLGVAPAPVNVGVAQVPVNVGVAQAPVNFGVAQAPVNFGVAPAPVNFGVAPASVNFGVAPAPVNFGVTQVGVGTVPANFGFAPGTAPFGALNFAASNREEARALAPFRLQQQQKQNKQGYNLIHGNVADDNLPERTFLQQNDGNVQGVNVIGGNILGRRTQGLFTPQVFAAGAASNVKHSYAPKDGGDTSNAKPAATYERPYYDNDDFKYEPSAANAPEVIYRSGDKVNFNDVPLREYDVNGAETSGGNSYAGAASDTDLRADGYHYKKPSVVFTF